MTEQCRFHDEIEKQCAYVEGHSGDHLFPSGNEDLSDEIRLKVLRDRRDSLEFQNKFLVSSLAGKDAEIAKLHALLQDEFAVCAEYQRTAAVVMRAKDEACEIAEAATFILDNGLCASCRDSIENVHVERIDELRKVGR